MFASDTLYYHKNAMQQSDGGLSMLIDAGNKCIELDNGVLFAKPLNSESVMTVSVSGKLQRHYHYEVCERLKTVSQPIVLSTLDNMKVNFNGKWFVEKISMSQATTLFSFLDYQAKSRVFFVHPCLGEMKSSSLIHTERNLALLVKTEFKSMMEMLILSLLNPQESQLKSLFSFIRNVESYWIAYFLLSQIMNEDKGSDDHRIRNVCKIYGVSENYFRKLCRHAFAMGPKKQLRLWRATHSVLQLIENDNSVAVIAGKNGYASSSHFSSEIKSLFGITPREFKKLENLFHV